MKHCSACVPAAILWASLLTAADSPLGIGSKSRGGNTACHGTTIEFVDTPVAAAKLAAKQKKLVFILHVSGHFEDPTFT